MAGIAVRLQAANAGAEGEVEFAVLFAADAASEDSAACAAAELRAGDGSRYDLGLISPPTAVTWREQRTRPVVRHAYAGPGPYTAELYLDGLAAASVVVEPGEAEPRAAATPEAGAVALFALAAVPGAAEQRVLKIHTPPIPAGRRLRVDGGAGQARDFAGEPGQEVVADIQLVYPKPGRYTVGLDLLDGEGFLLETLAETELEIADPADTTEPAETTAPPLLAPDERGPVAAPAAAAPWLPYRNFKSKPGGARTYSAAGGGAVRRWVGTGTWLTLRREALAGGARWYQTAGGDWIKADAVVFFVPSELRGVELAATQPPPPPPPPGNRKGVVTATTLNVRARPGVSAGNPPVGSLRAGNTVIIYEERQVGGQNWYRIGVDRWVAAQYVRVAEARPVAENDARAGAAPALPLGWVVPDKLDVRAQPGVAAGNLVIDQLQHNARVPILEETTVAGAKWYRIGEGRWVEARQVGAARRKARPASIPANALWVGVSLSQQTAVCYEGDTPVYAALIASGLPGAPTVQGIFRTWKRLETGKMAGPGYYIEDVTWTCYFYSGYALHTAYWHDKFGKPRSHGCVNLSPYDAWWVYQWSAKGGPNSPTVYVYWA